LKDYTKEIIEITDMDIISSGLNGLIQKYGTDKISKENQKLKVGDFVFSFSFGFNDITYNDGHNFLTNLSFLYNEGEQSYREVVSTFPTFKKISDFFEKYNGDTEIVLSDNFEEDEIYLVFSDFSELSEYILNFYNKLPSLIRDFYKEIEEYLKNLYFITIEDSYPKKVPGNSNGGVFQEILFKSEKNLFKISILSESVTRQSYARLSCYNDSGWTVLQSFNPEIDFNINLSYKNDFRQDVFKPIIKRLYVVAESVDSVI